MNRKSALHRTFIDIFNNAYWSIYGQLDVVEEMNKCYENPEEKCDNEIPLIISYGVLMLYMGISSVLLLNLLIAMFT